MRGDRQEARRHLLPHFTRGDAWRGEGLLVIERGEGCYVWDAAGNKYLDALAGLFCTNIGHGRSDLTAAAAKQMDRLAFYPNWGFAHPSAIEAASMIAGFAPADIDRVFFVSSGSEAVESALKFARCYHLANGDEDRYKVVARDMAYHGTTLGALALTGIPSFRDPFLPIMADNVLSCPQHAGVRRRTRPARPRAVLRDCDRGGNRRGGSLHRRHGHCRAGAERPWRASAPGGLLAGVAPDLRHLRRAALRR